jgi:hypothetical protein
MNSIAAQEYNYFSLLANLKRNKLHCSLWSDIPHLFPPELSLSLSLPPPLSETAATAPTTNKASNLVLPFLLCFFLKKDLRLRFHLFN